MSDSTEIHRALQFLDRLEEDRNRGRSTELPTPEEIQAYERLKARVDAYCIQVGYEKTPKLRKLLAIAASQTPIRRQRRQRRTK